MCPKCIYEAEQKKNIKKHMLAVISPVIVKKESCYYYGNKYMGPNCNYRINRKQI